MCFFEKLSRFFLYRHRGRSPDPGRYDVVSIPKIRTCRAVTGIILHVDRLENVEVISVEAIDSILC